MARTQLSRDVEQQERVLAKLSCASAAQHRQLVTLRTATDKRIERIARHIRSEALMDEFEQLVDLILTYWDDTITIAEALESAQEYIKADRRRH